MAGCWVKGVLVSVSLVLDAELCLHLGAGVFASKQNTTTSRAVTATSSCGSEGSERGMEVTGVSSEMGLWDWLA
eukprot:3135795-Amphidinium_carterae.3